jgi:hypothetical protein
VVLGPHGPLIDQLSLLPSGRALTEALKRLRGGGCRDGGRLVTARRAAAGSGNGSCFVELYSLPGTSLEGLVVEA